MPLNASGAIVVTVCGTTILSRDEQFENAPLKIEETLFGSSTVFTVPLSLNAFEPIDVTPEGI